MTLRRSLILALASIGVTTVATASEVSATSCAVLLGYSWQTIADGSAVVDFEGSQIPPVPFFDVYESVVIGEVVGIDGDMDGGYPDGVSVSLEVVGAIRADSVEPMVILHQGDRGEMNGFPFVLGQTYMVPLRAESANQVNLCESIIEVSADSAVQALDIATESGFVVAVPTLDAAVAEPQPLAGANAAPIFAAEDEDSSSPGLRALARWVGVALVAAMATWFVRRRRGR